MEKHERVLAALELREPDRVPTFDLMNENAVINEVLGLKPNVAIRLLKNESTAKAADWLFKRMDSRSFVDKEMERFTYNGAAAAVKMGYDAAWVSHTPHWYFSDSKTMIDVFGRLQDVSIDAKGNIANPIYRKGLIAGPADWEAWDKKPIFSLPEKVNRVFSGVQKEYGDQLFIFGFASYGVFENSWQAMGFERFVMAVRKDKEFVRRLIGFNTDFFCILLEAMADAGLPGVIYTDDLAFRSGPMFSPKLIDEFFGDSYRRITEKAHSLGLKIVFHSCGDTTSLLSMFADCGFDAIHPMEPTAGMILSEVKETIGNRICLIGNLDVTSLMVSGTREEVFAAVRKMIAEAGAGGGYILGPGHGHPGISAKRLRWMVEAAHQYGHYPLDLS
ncbi:MAG: hypothetical protein GX883_09080 [Firmicutes bacterium]|nr:hypothetical protein [Bacillota bacterium]